VDRGKRWKLKRVCHHPPINEALSSAPLFAAGLSAPPLMHRHYPNLSSRGSSDNLEDELGRGTSAVVFAIKRILLIIINGRATKNHPSRRDSRNARPFGISFYPSVPLIYTLPSPSLALASAFPFRMTEERARESATALLILAAEVSENLRDNSARVWPGQDRTNI